jgi:hypothetical protein
MAELIADLANVDIQTAEKALEEHKEVWLAVDALMLKPVTAGDKYIPPKPKVNTGLTLEQQTICERGRWLQDRVNAVFSVAHSKTLPQPDDLPAAPAPSPVLVGEASVPTIEEQLTGLQLDADEKMTQPDQISSQLP